MKKLLSVLLLLVFFGCKTPCNDPSGPPALIANAIVSQWNCQNSAQVNADVEAWFASKNMCTAPSTGMKTGILADIFCPLAVDGLQNAAAGAVPPDWQCNPALIGANAAAGLTALCELIPF
jgi:hypothetical protein